MDGKGTVYYKNYVIEKGFGETEWSVYKGTRHAHIAGKSVFLGKFKTYKAADKHIKKLKNDS